MNMKETVARIVDLMFENTEMTEEVTALRDEVMNNCQERYADLTASGIPEDDAVAAVVESLKGMEDVISQYKRSAPKDAGLDADDAEDSGHRNVTFAAHMVTRVDMLLVAEDVTVEASSDDAFHVLWEEDEDTHISTDLNDGVLKIERNGSDGKKAKTHIHIDASDEDKRVYVNGEELDFEKAGKTIDGVGSLLEGLGRAFGKMFSSARNLFGGCDRVTVQIPANACPEMKIVTTSGDVDVSDVLLKSLTIISTSGDVDVDLDEDQSLGAVEIRTTSGDAEASVFCDRAHITSTSGDVEVEGRIRSLTVNTVSGDIDVRADVQDMTFKSISGDVEMEFDSDEIRAVNGSTMSGDIDVDLPHGIGTIAISTHTRSGDVTTRYGTNGTGPVVTGSISTMSGDITIR